MFRSTLIFIFAALPALAGEYAVLSSGLRIHADRHEQSGDRVQLFNSNGRIDLPASFIISFEEEENVPQPAPPVAPEAPKSPEAPQPSPKLTPREMVRAAATRSGLPPEFVESVAKTESAFHPDAISSKGALGVMQLMPETARTLGADPRDTQQNIDAGARLLRELLIKYDGDVVKALSAYNAGEGAVDRYHGMPPYVETQQYVNKVVRDYIRNGGK